MAVGVQDNGSNNELSMARYFQDTYLPDVSILNKGGYLGDDVYANTLTPGQTVMRKVRAGKPVTFTTYVVNDGGSTQALEVAGTAGTKAFAVTYRLSGTDVTTLITAGPMTLGSLEPGEGRTLTVRITPKAKAHKGAHFTASVRLDPEQGPTFVDVAGVTALVR